jgi:phosphoribosyl 1,2-cyclic phosphodiesterase
MRVTLYGTRGSIPTPGPETTRYGGNTPSVLVSADNGSVLVLDAGTGIRRLGAQLSPATTRIDILLTHLHMDHIQGLGFFSPIHNPEIEVHLWGPASNTLSLEAHLSRYLSPPLFPVHLRDLPSIACHHLPRSTFNIGPFRILTSLVSHPGPTVGYRIEGDGGVVTYLSDHEPALCLIGAEWPRREWVSGFDLAVETDLLIHDAQYSDAEYQRCVGWGHSSYQHAFEFATYVGARKFIPFHHDPNHDDETLDLMYADALRRLCPRFVVSPGCEGSVFEI